MARKLEQIEYLQAELRAATTGLHAILTIRPLAGAYAQFQAEGGG